MRSPWWEQDPAVGCTCDTTFVSCVSGGGFRAHAGPRRPGTAPPGLTEGLYPATGDGAFHRPVERRHTVT